jgi:hypothetical protein
MSKRELDPKLMNEPQTGHMKVHSKILKDLSSGIYSNPANSIKELVINSYDADALKVTIVFSTSSGHYECRNPLF